VDYPNTYTDLIDNPAYFGPDRRKRRRLALQDLTPDDAEQYLTDYVKQMPPEDLEQDPETFPATRSPTFSPLPPAPSPAVGNDLPGCRRSTVLTS
jgi:hypothetical protein